MHHEKQPTKQPQFIQYDQKERGSPPFLVVSDESSAQKWWFKPT